MLNIGALHGLRGHYQHTAHNEPPMQAVFVRKIDKRYVFYQGEAADSPLFTGNGGAYRDQDGKMYRRSERHGLYLSIENGIMEGFERPEDPEEGDAIWEKSKKVGLLMHKEPNGFFFTGNVNSKGEKYGILTRKCGSKDVVVGGPAKTTAGVMHNTFVEFDLKNGGVGVGMLEVKANKMIAHFMEHVQELSAESANNARQRAMESMADKEFRVMVLQTSMGKDAYESEKKVTLEPKVDEYGIFTAKWGEEILGYGTPETILRLHQLPKVTDESPLWLKTTAVMFGFHGYTAIRGTPHYMGYTEKFIEVATEGLMVYVTRGPAPAATAASNKKP